MKVRELIRLPLRGELTSSVNPASNPSTSSHMDSMQDLFVQMIRLSASSINASVPEIVVSPSHEHGQDDAAAPWSWTVAEENSAESSLLPVLVRLAVARDDVEALRFCLHYQDKQYQQGSPDPESYTGNFAAGVVNTVDPGSGWSSLHMAAFGGSQKCLSLLLRAGALVHLRDSLGHTALYYVRILADVSLATV